MARIRYVGEQLIARAFERTFHRNHWDEDHGLQDCQVAVLKHNPQFEVDGLDVAADPAIVVRSSDKISDGLGGSVQ